MKLSAFGKSDKGPQRELNEDSFLIDEELGLFVVCDGMGGHARGDLASQLAASVFHETVKKRYSALLKGDSSTPGDLSSKTLKALLVHCVGDASRAVFEKAEEDPNLKGMGTTLTALLLYAGTHGTVAVMAHVGDSRLYLMRSGEIQRLSRDHRLLEDMVSKGMMTEEEAAKSPYQHVLSRAVGVKEVVQVDTLSFELLPQDRLFICSDGVNELFPSDSELGQELSQSQFLDLPNSLVSKGNAQNCSDNITALCIQIEQPETDQQPQSEISLKLESLKKLYLFEGLKTKTLIRLVEASRVRRLAADSRIITAGDTSSSLFVLLDGRCRVSLDGKELAVLEKGNHFGEMSLIGGCPRSANVDSLSDVCLLELQQEEFEAVAREEPYDGLELIFAMSRELCQRLQDSNEKLAAISQ